MKRPVQPQVLEAIKKAGKTQKDLPPVLPPNEMLNPYDVYTVMPAYEVLQGLEASVTSKLKATLCRPSYNEIGDETLDVDANNDAEDASFDGTYIDVVNFSLVFGAALQDLVKFTRLSGEREAFKKIIDTVSIAAGIYLTGL